MSTAAIARNAPCPCGSGRRYKDCHGAVGARSSEPLSADSLLREAQVALASGNATAAHALLDRAIALEAKRSDLLREHARVERSLGDDRAATSCRAALELDPGDVAAWNLLGEILKATDADAAEAAWREALRIDPRNPEALFHLGNRLHERGDEVGAIDLLEQALLAAPDHAGVLNNLALALTGIGRTELAEARYREALAAQPRNADALANLASLLQTQKRYREAILLYERALGVRRDFPATFWIARGIALNEVGAYPDAEQSLREALRLIPDHLPTLLDLGSICVVQAKFDEAVAPLASALALDPGNPYACSLLAHCRMQLCQWEGLEESFARLRGLIATDEVRETCNAVPFPLLAMPLGPEIELAFARRFAAQIARQVASLPRLEPRPARATDGRLRVGYVSSDFRTHAMASLLCEVWERHGRARLETHAYSIGPGEDSPLRARIEAAFEHFVDCAGEGSERIAGRIAADGVEVLIDLNGYTTHAKSELFALRPAPVQLSWLGYLGTLGAPWYDYVITDRFVVPPAQAGFFSERLLYLPDCYCPSDTRRPVAGALPSREGCGLPASGLVLCCFNNHYKILPPVFAVWMRLLAAVPGSVLWLSPGNATAAANLRREAQRRGVAGERLVFAPRVELSAHLARHVHADLFLDTAPYNAGTTANDALFMGVPVVSCAGETMASRVAGSQLHAIGLSELVTETLEQYEALALALALDPQRLHAYRARLAANRLTQPLFDMARFTRNLDELLLAAWENRRSAPAPGQSA